MRPGPYLRRLGLDRPIVFHGTPTPGLEVLTTERRSRDAAEYGDRQVVYASQDPVWALFSAVLERGPHLGSMRNGSLGVDRSPLDRRYFFSVDRPVGEHPVFGAGWLHVLPATVRGRHDDADPVRRTVRAARRVQGPARGA